MNLTREQIDAEARHLAAELGWNLSPAADIAPTVAIVGGGPGGLMTAYLLQKKLPQAKVTIFEAGRRLGGKILTCAFSDGTPYEGGVAELYEYHSPAGDPDPFRQLIEDDLGLHTVNMEGGGVILGDDILPDWDAVAAAYGEETRQALERFHATCAELMPLEKYASRWQADNSHEWAPLTFHACIKAELGDFPHAERYVRAACHSDLATEPTVCNGLNGAKNVLMDNDRYLNLYHVVGGISEVVHAIEARLTADVRYNSRVKNIGRDGQGRYVVTLDDGSKADFNVVFVCLPNHWLAQLSWEDEQPTASLATEIESPTSPGEGWVLTREGPRGGKYWVHQGEAADTNQAAQEKSETKVVDAAGKPLLMFHGAASKLASFDPARIGETTGHPTAPLGFFFSPEESEGKRYAGFGRKGEGHVHQAYLDIRNPYRMTGREFAKYTTMPAEESKKLADQLRSQGYDGVHIDRGGPQPYRGKLFNADEWVAFDPQQIKLVES